MDRSLEKTIALALDEADYTTARELVAYHSDPDGCLAWIETYRDERQREKYIAHIRQLWRTERDGGQRNPPPELGTDLDALTLEEVGQLGRAVRRRVDTAASHGQIVADDCESQPTAPPDPYADLPALPDEWRWIGRYRAEHPEHGRTGTSNDPRRLLKDLRKRQPKPPKRDEPPEPRVQGELFSA